MFRERVRRSDNARYKGLLPFTEWEDTMHVSSSERRGLQRVILMLAKMLV